MKNYLWLCALVIFVNCNNHEDKTNPEKDASPPPLSTVGSIKPGCYQMIIGNDSALFNVNVSNQVVTGTLLYNRAEKDDNRGEFAGTLDSNKITGWYTFQAEGLITVRQAVFKVMGDKLAEGYGDVEAKGDTAIFRFPQTLNYEEKHPFQKVNCP